MTVNGVSAGPVTEYTLTNISENTVIEAVFEKEEQTGGSEGGNPQDPDTGTGDQQDPGDTSGDGNTQTDNGNTGNGADSTINTAADTGDNGNIIIWISLLAAAGAVIILIRKKAVNN